jgi:hypothetical protein
VYTTTKNIQLAFLSLHLLYFFNACGVLRTIGQMDQSLITLFYLGIFFSLAGFILPILLLKSAGRAHRRRAKIGVIDEKN